MPDKKRRKLLKLIGLGGVFASSKSFSQITINRVLTNKNLQLATEYISVKLLRPEDLLSLELRYYNFNLSGNQLIKKGNPAFLMVVFQSQSMMEQAWTEDETKIETPTVPGKMISAGDSRLVFKFPTTKSSVQLTAQDLLAWQQLDLVVNNRAKTAAIKKVIRGDIRNNKLGNFQRRISSNDIEKRLPVKKGLTKDEKKVIVTAGISKVEQNVITRVNSGITDLIRDPVGPVDKMETALEMPVRLYLSPTNNAGWLHRDDLRKDEGLMKATNRLFELWHTRMGVKKGTGIVDDDLVSEEKILRALWADDADISYSADVVVKDLDNQVGLTSMTNKDRHRIVHESSNFLIPQFYPQPIRAYKLFLSTLGGWLDSELLVDRASLAKAGILNGTSGLNAMDLLKWRHIETLGREHYVEIVTAGNILPFGHEAVLIKITERKPHPGTGTAANFQRQLIVITEPEKDYNYRDADGKFLQFSFSNIRMMTTVTPKLDSTKKPFVSPSTIPVSNQFIITSGNKEVQFKIKGTDLNGNMVDFSMPLVFVSSEALGPASNRKALVDQYNNDSLFIYNTSAFSGQKFSLAPGEENGADTAFCTHKVLFGAMQVNDPDELQGFLPTIRQADIIEPSYQKLTGQGKPVPVSLFDDNNIGHVFASFIDNAAVNFNGNSDKTGGLATPNFNLSGLSKAAGAFGGAVADFAMQAPKGADFFSVESMPDPTLFGVFKLSEILSFVNGDAGSFDLSVPIKNRLSKIPNLLTNETDSEYITTYVLKPKISSLTIGDFVRFKPSSENAFSISTTVIVKKASPVAVPEFTSKAALVDFTIGVVKVESEYLVNINFKQIKFETYANKKPDISVDMKDETMTFGGPLSFVNELIKLIPPGGFSDPPYLDVSPVGIKCGYTLALPNLQMGAFTLSHLSIGAEVNLPFTGAPMTVGFRFCERQQPFTLTVSCLGGGGFFGLELDLQGLRQIEAALEFGAAVSVNFGVASGSVSIMAGIYFKMIFETGQNSTQLTGYVRINGSVSVLGLITASLELYLALTYLFEKHKAYGEASLKISVEVLFFSTSVTIKTQKTFSGDGNDPNFQAAISATDWKEYCEAFAA